MNMKKMIVEFREFQCKGNSLKWKSKKMARFKHVTIQIGQQDAIFDVTVTIHMGADVTFGATGFRYYFEEEDFQTYDNGLDDPDSVLLVLTPPEQNILLRFNAANEMTSFIQALRAFLNLSDEEQSPRSHDSGRTTLS